MRPGFQTSLASRFCRRATNDELRFFASLRMTGHVVVVLPLARETFAWHKTTLTGFQTDPAHDVYANSATSISRCRTGNALFLGAFQKANYLGGDRCPPRSYCITGYRFYSDRRAAAASAALASANSAQEYEQVIARYPNTPAGADAYILLAEAQRKETKFTEANKTLETFIAKYPKHELVSTAKMAMAANLDSMGKTDEALAMYQQIASTYPTVTLRRSPCFCRFTF